ncbi:MAG: type IV secretory system conjugative DNA transfer family protein [Thermodesulfovibrionales bacterium]
MVKFVKQIADSRQIFAESELDRCRNTPDFYLGRGGVFTGSQHLRSKGDVVVPEAILKAHIIILGATRSGKTVLLKSLVSQAIRKGMGVMLVDFKPDGDLFQTSFYESVKAGRQKDFMFYSPNLAAQRNTGGVFPNSSDTYNPLMSGSQEEIVSRILRSISDFDKNSGGDKFWEDIKEDVIDAITGCLMGMDKVFNYNDIWTCITSKEAMRYVIENTKNLQSRMKLAEVYQFFQQSAESAKKYYKGTQVALGYYATGAAGEYYNSYDPSINLEDVVRKKKILHVALSPQLAEKTASGIAKLLISDLNSIVGRVLTTTGKLESRFLVIVDEFENAVFKGVNDLFNKSAGAGITMVVGHQSLHDLDLKAGPAMRNIILDNTQTKVFMLQAGTEGAELLSKIGGKTFRTRSQMNEYSVFNPFVFFEKNIRREEMPLMDPNYITALEPLNFYAKIGDRVHRGVLPIIPAVSPEAMAKEIGGTYSYDRSKEDSGKGLRLFEKFCSNMTLDLEAPPKKYGRKV